MKIKYLLLSAILFPFLVNAAYISNYPITITQPDGQTITCFLTGDEFYNWMHDANNYTVVRNPENGYYCYAVNINNELVPSPYLVGKIIPSSVGINPGINLTSDKILKIRKELYNKYYAYTNKSKISIKSTGTINNIVIFIRFSGENEFTQNASLYNNMFNSSGTISLKNYFEEVSYNQLQINSTFYPASTSTVLSYQDIHTRNYYAPYDALSNPYGYNGYYERIDREHTLLVNAVNAVSSQVPSALNIDNNNDGFVDNVCYIISGAPTAWSTLLWPHRWSLFSQMVYINGKRVYDYNFQINNHLLTKGVSVLAHEMFHTLGAPDLYHYNHDAFSPVSYWDVMENNQNPPQSMGAYMKYRYGQWISSIPVISSSGTYTLNPVTSPVNNCYRINSSVSSDEYFIVEYRQDTGLYESSLPGAGLIIYRINSLFDGMGNAMFNGTDTLDEVYIYRPNGTITTNGEPYKANFSANSGRKKFSNTTNPYCFLSDGTPGVLDISNVTVAGNTISFDLKGGTVHPVDAGIETLLNPVSGCNVLASQPITLKIKNYGSTSIGTGLQLCYSIDGGTVVTEPYNGSPIPHGGVANFTFSQLAAFPENGNYNIVSYIYIPSDGNTANDTIKTIVCKGDLSYDASDAQNYLGLYTDLGNNGNIINTSNFDDANSSPVNIGFTFEFNCNSFTQFVLNTNGFIKLGSAPPSLAAMFFDSSQVSDGGILNSTDTSDVNIICAFNHDLQAGVANPEYRVFTSGNAPDRVCIIQFENVRDKTSNPLPQFDNIEFQIKLYETSNLIEIVYGNWQASSNPNDYKTSVVGLKGQGNEYKQLLLARKSYTLDWTEIVFDNANYYSISTFNFGNIAPPDEGRTLAFNINLNIPTASTDVASVLSSNSAILNGIVNANNLTTSVTFEYGQTTSYGNTVNAAPFNLYGSSYTPVSANIAGLSANTTYHYRVVAVNSMGTSYGNDMTFSTAVGIEESSIENLFTMMPNPTSGLVNINCFLSCKQKIKAKIVNSIGYAVFSGTFNLNSDNQNITIDITEKASGLYFLILETEKRVIVKKLIKE